MIAMISIKWKSAFLLNTVIADGCQEISSGKTRRKAKRPLGWKRKGSLEEVDNDTKSSRKIEVI